VNYVDIGIEHLIRHASNPFNLCAILEESTASTNTDYLGLVPVQPFPYSFSVEDLLLMRRINEEVYDMPGLKSYFNKFTPTSRPDEADHPMRGRWTEQAETRFLRLCARCHTVSAKQKNVIMDWKRIEQFVMMYPVLLPPFVANTYNSRWNQLHKRYANDMTRSSFLRIIRDVMEFPKDKVFERALAEFEQN
jgi:hypothetical protein